MLRSKYDSIKKEIDTNTDKINNYVLTSTKGTKKLQAKFNREASLARNKIVTKEEEKFKTYKAEIYEELVANATKLTPESKADLFTLELKTINNYKDLIILNLPNIDNNYKIGFTKLISNLDDETSLIKINENIKAYIDKFQETGVFLTTKDFDYSMFVEDYIASFFENIGSTDFNNNMQKSFENIYWECPDLIMHIKLTMTSILTKYRKQIDNFIMNKKATTLNKENITSNMIIPIYNEKWLNYTEEYATDEFNNFNLFATNKIAINDYLASSATRSKNFNEFALNNSYIELTPLAKTNYDKEMFNFYNALKELKRYYLFEPVVADLTARYKKKDENKGAYEAKEKELATEEKKRAKIYADYHKAITGGLFKKKPDTEKARVLKLQMNEEMTKLNTLYNELSDLDINRRISKELNPGSSIFDLLNTSLGSYHYLKTIMLKTYSDREDFDLDKLLAKYFRFIYNPHNTFINKINVFSMYDLSEVVAEKYQLSGLNITKDALTKDNLDATKDTIRYITLVNNIAKGKLSVEEMKFICDVKAINYDPTTTK